MERAFQRSQMRQKLDLWLLGLWKHKFLLLGYSVCGTCLLWQPWVANCRHHPREAGVMLLWLLVCPCIHYANHLHLVFESCNCGWRDQRQRNVKFTQLQRKKNGIQNLSMSLLGCSPPDPDREVLKLLLPYPWNCWSSFPMSIQGSPKSCLIVMRSDWLKEPFWIPQRLTGFTLEMWECLKGRGVKPLHVTVSFPHSLESHWAPDCLSPVLSRHSSAVSIFSCVRHISQWTP